MIILICDWFDTYNQGIPTGKKEYLVSHGYCTLIDKSVILPCEHPRNLGAKVDEQTGEWVI